ncbi:Basement membrane-specific heparan sulfate proteoglycan core protein [Exaiptasia diaphana]|nr:Basement membrane-specific heparan sulfate proteoglycan core protein [Exaiptasia diaphana]
MGVGVSLAYTEDYSGVRGAVRLGDRLGLTVINTGILLVNEPPHYVYNRFDRLPRKTFYWYLPEQFLGDKISAYGGYLKFVLSHDMLLGGQVTSESDVEIRGHGLVLFHKMSSPPVSGVETPYKLRIVECIELRLSQFSTRAAMKDD